MTDAKPLSAEEEHDIRILRIDSLNRIWVTLDAVRAELAEAKHQCTCLVLELAAEKGRVYEATLECTRQTKRAKEAEMLLRSDVKASAAAVVKELCSEATMSLERELDVQTKRAEEAERAFAESRKMASLSCADRWCQIIVTPNEAAGCLPCDTCGGFRVPEHPCQFCIGRMKRQERDLATLRSEANMLIEGLHDTQSNLEFSHLALADLRVALKKVRDLGHSLNPDRWQGQLEYCRAVAVAALAAVASKETSGPGATGAGQQRPQTPEPERVPEDSGPAREKWYSSGRGIFKQDAAFQVACASATVNWQEDTAMMVRLLNAGEGADAALAEVRKVVAEMREWNVVADVQSWADRLDAAIGGG